MVVWSELNRVLFDLVQNDMMMMMTTTAVAMMLLKVINLTVHSSYKLPQVTGPILLSETRQMKLKKLIKIGY